MKPSIGASAVNAALRSAWSRGDRDAVRRICKGVPESVVQDVCEERADFIGDSAAGMTVRYRTPEPGEGT